MSPNDQPMIEVGASTLIDGIDEQTDKTGDATPLTATGTIAFSDADVTDIHSVPPPTLVSADWTGGTLPAGNPGVLSFGTVDDANGTVDWTYTVADNALDFLAEGETLTVTYEVAIADDSGSGNATSATQQIVVTITGTNDQPVIDVGASTLTGGIDEQTDTTGDTTPLTATGTVAFTDADLTDTHSVPTPTFVSADWSGGEPLAIDPGALSFDPVSDATGSVDWTYTIADNAVDFLAEGETLTVTYEVAIADDSGSGNATSATQQIVVTITGTNDQPVIDVGASTLTDGIDEQTDTTGDATPLEATGTVAFTDADLTDIHSVPTPTFVSADWSGGTLPAGNPGALSFGTVDDVNGTVDWTYTVNDSALDFLAEGETLTVT